MAKIRTTLLMLAIAVMPMVASADTGILLLAHGGSPEWNNRVLDLVRQVNQAQPTEVAFGMATRANIQAAVDRLTARGVGDIVAVPLFISSWSSVVTSTEFLLGLRADPPAALAVFAKMSHADPVAPLGAEARSAKAAADAHAGHGDHAADLGSTPVTSKVPIKRMSAALNGHEIAARILTTRAKSISQSPAAEAVIIVAHGPTSDEENQKWLQDMSMLAANVGRAEPFASVDYLTVKDDAPKPVRDAATAELRALVTRRSAEGRRVLIVPLLMSFGGIEKGIVTRLEGLSYAMAGKALMPDDRLADWVLEMAKASR
jgi:sirohydrochlorin cobaltochelatase